MPNQALTPHDDMRYYPVVSETLESLAVDIYGTTIVFPATRRGAIGKQLAATLVYARISKNRGPEGGWNIQVSHVVYADESSSSYSGQVIGPVEVLPDASEDAPKIVAAVRGLGPHQANLANLRAVGFSKREIEAAVRLGYLAWTRDGCIEEVQMAGTSCVP